MKTVQGATSVEAFVEVLKINPLLEMSEARSALGLPAFESGCSNCFEPNGYALEASRFHRAREKLGIRRMSLNEYAKTMKARDAKIRENLKAFLKHHDLILVERALLLLEEST